MGLLAFIIADTTQIPAIGIPLRIVVGKKYTDGIVEYKLRTDEQSSDKEIKDAVKSAIEYIKANK